VRILDGPPSEPVVLVDGVLDAPGLNLSHWPGQRTPAHLRHELSTGSALAFAGLPEAEQERLAAGAVALANNHYDTDGTCALFALRYPELALPRAERLLACARAGDFFQAPDEASFAIDEIVSNLASPGSPIAAEVAGLGDRERWQRMSEHALQQLSHWLDGDLGAYRDLFAPALEHLHADRLALARAQRVLEPGLDLAVFQGTSGAPGRRALTQAAPGVDRILVLQPGRLGTTARLLFSTLSWFDLPGKRRLARPDLEALTARLNEREGCAPSDELAWRAQRPLSPAPELWFGRSGVSSYAEHNAGLAESRLSAAEIASAVRAFLAPRAS
jgi:hypothetical protein